MNISKTIILFAIISSILFAGDKGVNITPSAEKDPWYNVSYSTALEKLKGNTDVIWLLAAWSEIETKRGVYKWEALDRKVETAHKAGFKLGLRLQIILCGNDKNHNFVTLSRVPGFIKQDMSTEDFKISAAKFYGEAAKRYKGKVKYITIGNSINDYFEKKPERWEHFKKAYPAIVDAVHNGDPAVKIMADLTCGQEFWENKALLKKYLDYFASTKDDGVGFIFYFIIKSYYGDFKNFNKDTLEKVLDELHSMTKKNMHLLETACFSKHPKTGADMSKIQADYLGWILELNKEKKYMLGVGWWLLYDAKDIPSVPWDEKASFGLIDAEGKPKKSWEAWKNKAFR